MTDYYTQFCESLEINNWQRLWLEKHLHYMAHGPTKAEGPAWEAYAEQCRELGIGDVDGYGYDFQVEYEFEENIEGEMTFEGSVTFYADESGNPEHVAIVVQKLFQAFKLDHRFGMTYSHTASRMVLQSFSGGAIFVTRDTIEFCDAGAWLESQEEWFDSNRRTLD